MPGGAVRDGVPELVGLEGLRARLESNPNDTLLVGDFPVLPEGTLRGLHRVKTGRPRYPSARAVAEIGAGRLERDDIPHPDEIRPLYLREPDVTINWEKLRQAGPWG